MNLFYYFLLLWVIIGILISVIVYMLQNPSEVVKIGTIVSKQLSFISVMKKKYIEFNIENRVNEYVDSIKQEANEILPYGINIEWVNRSNVESIVNNGEIIIRMKKDDQDEKNLVYATMAYISKGLLPQSRSYLDSVVSKSIDLTIGNKIFLKEHMKGSLEIFSKDVLMPEINSHPKIKEYFSTLSSLDNIGLFTRILLREYHDLGRKIFPRPPDMDILTDTEQTLNILTQIAHRKRGENINPTYIGNNIRFSIVFIGREETLMRGVEPFLNHINNCIDKEIYTFYLVSAGQTNNAVNKLISNRLKNHPKIIKILEQEYYLPYKKGRRTKAILILYKEKIFSGLKEV